MHTNYTAPTPSLKKKCRPVLLVQAGSLMHLGLTVPGKITLENIVAAPNTVKHSPVL